MRHDPASAAVVVMLRALKMYGMAQAVSDLTEQGAPAFDAAVPILSQLLKAELAEREVRSIAYQIKAARFPAYKDLAGFDFSSSEVNEALVRQLHRGEFIDGADNVVLIGGPGTGKTHIALAIGNRALQQGYKVFFASMDSLIHILKTAEISRNSQARIKWIKEADLLIIDELGYLPISRVEANLFFQLISQLYENTSVVITSNKGFDGWADLLGDPILATALLDRLTHKCQVLSFSDNSYRLAHRKEIF